MTDSSACSGVFLMRFSHPVEAHGLQPTMSNNPVNPAVVGSNYGSTTRVTRYAPKRAAKHTRMDVRCPLTR